jgi:hypothetical protein
VIRSSDAELAADSLRTLDPEGSVAWYRGASEQELLAVAPGPSTLGDLSRWVELVEARTDEVPAAKRRQLAETLRAQLEDGQRFEEYRVVSSDEALLHLAPARA